MVVLEIKAIREKCLVLIVKKLCSPVSTAKPPKISPGNTVYKCISSSLSSNFFWYTDKVPDMRYIKATSWKKRIRMHFTSWFSISPIFYEIVSFTGEEPYSFLTIFNFSENTTYFSKRIQLASKQFMHFNIPSKGDFNESTIHSIIKRWTFEVRSSTFTIWKNDWNLPFNLRKPNLQ